ncbi:succinate dehydrogenase/fumarate reductase iron-sulfur subunit [Methanococcoides alaskense]|uniref:succinate dehydrogenase n=1 Tax=Methanococcoides alaskense TaxID=325778 RepID=A0AA90TYP0_9EURY|nr:succinate dehydrogenase/fumarate reductase iron-sulfur subunit [Methanococcoides alaskense]MDR6222603.1 succinate dehydrogenase / fumarate reductase iron-sulfur subunit [Methanococcoides alaskense]
MITLKVKRQEEENVWYQEYEVEDRPGMTILEALFYAQEKLDPSLTFRYACRGAVCGSCGMLINRIPRLACKMQISEMRKEPTNEGNLEVLITNKKTEIDNSVILIEPLPNLRVIRDLVVDMEPFYSLLEDIKPWLEMKENVPEKENLMDRDTQVKIEQYTNCILCALCHGSCPVAAKDKQYYGPAALAKAWRFYLDPREKEESKQERLAIVDSESGVWGCDTVYKCVAVCPKKVAPTLAINELRGRIEDKKEKREK